MAKKTSSTRFGAAGTIDFGSSAKDRASLNEGLDHLLADTFTQYLRVHHCRWNVLRAVLDV
ncbi:MAG: hypothetical protein ABIR54_14490 [Burkholderiaceae bacterium]|jgi:starvation-inducible DNA-binding protein